MLRVITTAEANDDLARLPSSMFIRVEEVLRRLGEWPSVSGAKPLRGNLKGSFRIRTGTYRILFRVDRNDDTVVVWRIDNRRDVYED